MLPYSIGMLKPKYSLNLRPEDCGPPGTPPRGVQQLLQKSNQNASTPSTGPFENKKQKGMNFCCSKGGHCSCCHSDPIQSPTRLHRFRANFGRHQHQETEGNLGTCRALFLPSGKQLKRIVAFSLFSPSTFVPTPFPCPTPVDKSTTQQVALEAVDSERSVVVDSAQGRQVATHAAIRAMHSL